MTNNHECIKTKLINKGVDREMINKYDEGLLEQASQFEEIDFKFELMVELIERGAISYYANPTDIDFGSDEEPVIPDGFDEITYTIFNISEIIERNYNDTGNITNVKGNELFKLAESSDLYHIMTEYMGVTFKYDGINVNELKDYNMELSYDENYDT